MCVLSMNPLDMILQEGIGDQHYTTMTTRNFLFCFKFQNSLLQLLDLTLFIFQRSKYLVEIFFQFIHKVHNVRTFRYIFRVKKESVRAKYAKTKSHTIFRWFRVSCSIWVDITLGWIRTSLWSVEPSAHFTKPTMSVLVVFTANLILQIQFIHFFLEIRKHCWAVECICYQCEFVSQP